MRQGVLYISCGNEQCVKHKRLMEVGDRIEENQRDAGLMSISTKCVGFEISVTGIWMVRQDRLEI